MIPSGAAVRAQVVAFVESAIADCQEPGVECTVR